jgi:hypothetical protein
MFMNCVNQKKHMTNLDMYQFEGKSYLDAKYVNVD